MDVPRLLAIDHVNLTASVDLRDAIAEFYIEVVGFERIEAGVPAEQIVLRGFPRSGPRLIVNLSETLRGTATRRHALIQVASLEACAEKMAELRIWFEWSQGWFFFSRRLNVVDPGGNLIELVVSHSA